MSKKKFNYKKNLFFLLIIITIFIISKQENLFYEFPIETYGQDYLPIIPIHFKDYPSAPKYLVLDLNIDKSWVFNFQSSFDNQNNEKIIKNDFYTLSGNKDFERIYINSNKKTEKIEYLYFFNINQIKGPNLYPGVLSLNKKMNEYNLINRLKYKDENIATDKYFGFALDINNIKSNKAKLTIGNLNEANKGISKLIRIPLYEDEIVNEKDDKIKTCSKWGIQLIGLFIGEINKTLTKNITIEDKNNEKKIIYQINRKYNKGLIIDEPANIETIYNSIYVTKEAMLFLSANYFKGKENICFKTENKNKNEYNYEIKYNCLKKEIDKLNKINFVLENNITIQLDKDDLFNCAINQNLDSENEEKPEMCEFNIKYNKNVKNYILGLTAFRKYKVYFLFNDNSILLEGDKKKNLNCYINIGKFSNISRNKKKSFGQTIWELFSTTLCIAFIFALLYGAFYFYEKYNGKGNYMKEEEGEKMINRDKYANL